MAKWTQATREAYFKSHPENFAQPENQGYPIKDASDVDNAARLAGHADTPDATRKKIIEIAKRLGLSDVLPDSWKETMKDKTPTKPAARATQPDETTERAQNTPPAEDLVERNDDASDVLYYAPITRIDQERREVIGTATAEVKDAHGTVIGYDASKDAFARWAGNIREMHDPKRAVGRALEITPVDAERKIIVRAKISKGAQDTWEKLLDGTLTGFSIGGRNGKWSERIVDGEKVPFLERYDQSELSLVDNPSCPSSKDVAIVRAEGIAPDVLADEDETAPEITRLPETDIERAGAKISADTRDALHMARDHAKNAMSQTCSTCGCDDCIGMINKLAAGDDNDGDMDGNELAKPGAVRAMIAEIVRAEVADALRVQTAPVVHRINALLAYDAQRPEHPDFTRNFDALTQKNDALTSQLGAIQALVEKIAAQPVDGGPVLHGVDKRLSTQGVHTRYEDDADIIRRATELGFAPPSDPQAAVRAAAALVRPIPR